MCSHICPWRKLECGVGNALRCDAPVQRLVFFVAVVSAGVMMRGRTLSPLAPGRAPRRSTYDAGWAAHRLGRTAGVVVGQFKPLTPCAIYRVSVSTSARLPAARHFHTKSFLPPIRHLFVHAVHPMRLYWVKTLSPQRSHAWPFWCPCFLM